MPSHKGLRIAILASGPSLVEAIEKSNRYDIGIAINAAVRMPGLKLDYFLSNHPYAHLRQDWKKEVSNKNLKIIMNAESAPYWEELFPDEKVRLGLQKEYSSFISLDPRTTKVDGGSDTGKPTNPYFELFAQALNPHVAFNSIPIEALEGKLLDENEKILSSASSSGAAVHTAFLMGASEILLFGVQMTNHNGNDNYALTPSEVEKGITNEMFRKNLDRIFYELSEKNIPVIIHGNHAFECPYLKKE